MWTGPEIGSQNGFEELEHEYPDANFRPRKMDYLSRRSVGPVPVQRPEKSCSVYFSTSISGNVLRMANHQQHEIVDTSTVVPDNGNVLTLSHKSDQHQFSQQYSYIG